MAAGIFRRDRALTFLLLACCRGRVDVAAWCMMVHGLPWQDVDVYTYKVCDKTAFQSDFKHDGAADWFTVGWTGATTTCGTSTVLGGFNKLGGVMAAQRLVSLPLHSSLTVSFTFLKVCSRTAHMFHTTIINNSLAEH